MSAVDGTEIAKRLTEAELIPDNVRRIVIDIQMDSAVVVYYEAFASKRMVDVTVESLIKNKDELKIIPIE